MPLYRVFFFFSPSYFTMALKIVTLNVNGLRDANKRLSFLQWLSHLSAGIVCLQETHAAFASGAETWFSSFGFQVASSPGSIHSCGTAILFRSVFHLRNVWYDSEGRFVLCELSFRERVFRVCCIYAPNRNPARDDFFSFISDSVDPRFLLSYVVISMPFLIVSLIVEAPFLPMLVEKAVSHLLLSFKTVVSWIFGVPSILLCMGILGIGLMAPFPHALILWAVLIHGLPRLSLVISILVLFLTIVP